MKRPIQNDDLGCKVKEKSQGYNKLHLEIKLENFLTYLPLVLRITHLLLKQKTILMWVQHLASEFLIKWNIIIEEHFSNTSYSLHQQDFCKYLEK